MIFKGIYDAFLRYGLVIAIVTLWFPILNDKKKKQKNTCFISTLNMAMAQ